MTVRDVVLDTNVLFAGLYSKRGASYQILSMLTSGRLALHVSVPLIMEYEAVLKEHANDLNLTLRDVDDYLDFVCSVSTPHMLYFSWRPCLNDPNDEMLVEIAAASNCDFIVTHNIKHLKAVRGFPFRVVTPGDFLKLLRGEQ
jgi:putative PIN family toxin of toxin-antitoxin system